MIPSTRIAVYPGTFDPITNGHMDIISRASTVADKLIIAIGEHHKKSPPLFNIEERLAIVKSETDELSHLYPSGREILQLDKLLMNFVNEVNASCVIRGLRAVSDFEYELQMANTNSRLNPSVDTVFLMASEPNLFIASNLVREIARLGGDVSTFVSPNISKLMKELYNNTSNS